MKKLITLVFAAVMMTSFAAAQAGSTANGTLSVSAVVTGSISLVFNTDTAGGVPLTSGNGNSIASLAFGNVSAFGTLASTKITRTVGATTFTVSTPVDVFVSKFNSNSANYTLTAQLVTADAVNTWSVGGVAVSNTAAATVTTTGTYANNNPFAVAITIPFATPSGTSISNQITYTATSN
jgi:hypothetical protein